MPADTPDPRAEPTPPDPTDPARQQARCPNPRHDTPLHWSPDDEHAGRPVWRCRRGHSRYGGHIVERGDEHWGETRTARGPGRNKIGDGTITPLRLGDTEQLLEAMAAQDFPTPNGTRAGDRAAMARKIILAEWRRREHASCTQGTSPIES